jgi:hypothetical protein
MLAIVLIGAALLITMTMSRTLARRHQEASAAADRSARCRSLVVQIEGRRVLLERSASALGDLQAAALYDTLPRLRDALGQVRGLPLDDLSDPQLPVLSAHKRRRIAPAARALYGMAGTGGQTLGWLTDGTPAHSLLGVRLPAGARAMLAGEDATCSGDDLNALRMLRSELVQLSEDVAGARVALRDVDRRSATTLLELRIMLIQNRDYRSLTASAALPGQLTSPRQLIGDCVRDAQRLTALATAALRDPVADEQVDVVAGVAEQKGRSAHLLLVTAR